MTTYNDWFYGRNDHERWVRMRDETARSLMSAFDNEPWWERSTRVDAMPRRSFVDAFGPPTIRVRSPHIQEDTARVLTEQFNALRNSYVVLSDRMEEIRHLFL